MLVLLRHTNESIRIGDDIKIVVVEVRDPDTVRLGIEAPRDVPVHREEIYLLQQADGGVHSLARLEPPERSTALLPHPERGLVVLRRSDDGARILETGKGGRSCTPDDLDTIATYLQREADAMRVERGEGREQRNQEQAQP